MSSDGFRNVYDDETRAGSYAKLAFPGTYSLAFRDLPAILRRFVRGSRALDFGCGTGRSSRFLRDLGFQVTGIDIASRMLTQARSLDPHGDYRLVADGEFGDLGTDPFDLVLAAFTFDNIPETGKKTSLFRRLGQLLGPGGRIVSIVSAPEIYLHEWASFSTEAFPENRDARSGDRVRIIMLDVEDPRPVEDILCTDDRYREIYERAGLRPLDVARPLGRPDEPYPWKSETTVAPWTIYVLAAE